VEQWFDSIFPRQTGVLHDQDPFIQSNDKLRNTESSASEAMSDITVLLWKIRLPHSDRKGSTLDLDKADRLRKRA
jgi:hypothetical protein